MPCWWGIAAQVGAQVGAPGVQVGARLYTYMPVLVGIVGPPGPGPCLVPPRGGRCYVAPWAGAIAVLGPGTGPPLVGPWWGLGAGALVRLPL